MSRRLLYVVNEGHFFLTHRDAVAALALKRGFEVHVAVPADHVWAPDGFSLEEIEARGYFVHQMKISRRGLNPFQDLRTIWGILRLCRSIRPDILHNITIKPVVYGGLVGRFLGIPCLNHVTGLGHVFVAEGIRASVLKRLVRGLYRLASGRKAIFVVQNSGDRALLSELVGRDDIVVIPGSGVNLDTFRAVPEGDGAPLRVILPARLIWEKGIVDFVQAARILREEYALQVEMVLVGGTHASNPRAVPPAVLEDWVAQGYVSWWGRREDMPEVLASASVICLPTRYGEGVPKVLIESAAVGRPIVASNIAGCREVVRHGENGFLTGPGNIRELADDIRRLLSSRSLRQSFGVRGREIVEERFSEGRIAESTVDIYDRLLSQESG